MYDYMIVGGNSINAEVFTRDCPKDYDRWAEDEGCAGWSFDEMKSCFLKSEDNDTFAGDDHGHGGPLGVSSLPPLTRRFVRGCQQSDIPYTPDFNGKNQAGSGVYQTTTRHARRCSTATGYLRPASRRSHCRCRRLTQASDALGFPASRRRRSGCTACPIRPWLHLNSYLLRPKSRGSVRLTSGEVYDPRAVDPNYIADEHDLKMTVKGLKMMCDIMGQPALAPFIKTYTTSTTASPASTPSAPAKWGATRSPWLTHYFACMALMG
ncbi:MAG: GMC family oxidoreductase N-terminal domain-containing protein [Geminicoccaceae bacterium]